MDKYFEVKILERKKDKFDIPATLEGISHPDRYTYVITYSDWEHPDRGLRLRWGEALPWFKNGYCPRFAGMGEAWLVREVTEEEFNEKRLICRFEPAMTER